MLQDQQVSSVFSNISYSIKLIISSHIDSAGAEANIAYGSALTM